MVRAWQYRIFWFSLSNLLQSGIPLLRSLNVIIAQLSDKDKFGLGIKQIAASVQAGRTFAEAMAASNMFSPAEVNTVHAGEAIGNLELVALRIANGQIPSRADQYIAFYQTLGSLLRSGVPLLPSLRISENVFDEPFKKVIEKIYNSVKGGDSIAAPMDETGEFAATEVNLIDLGEETGQTDEMLLRLADLSRQVVFK